MYKLYKLNKFSILSDPTTGLDAEVKRLNPEPLIPL